MEPIAIVGLAGRFPGCSSIEAFWELVRTGSCALGPIPEDRRGALARRLLSSEHGVPDHLVSTHAGIVPTPDVSDLHPAIEAAGWSPSRIEGLDPLVRLILRVGADAWADAGVAVPGEKAGVILANIALPTDGARRWSEATVGRAAGLASRSEPDPLDRYVTAWPVGLLAQVLGLKGTAYSLDAACASSLYAIALACAELRAGRLDAALAGGASRPDCLYTSVGFSQLRALSPSGRSLPFTDQADGLVVGEGAGAFVLVRLADALRDGLTIRAVLRGEGLSNDREGSLLAPAVEGQVRALRTAYAPAGVAPESVDLVECHGTGTARGDATELQSLAALRGDGAPPVIGSVKSNVGHLLTGAGAAGLMKVVCALQHKVLPPSAGLTAGTAAAGVTAGGFRVLERAESWPQPEHHPRRAGISAFGFGGINAHLVVEEWTGVSPNTGTQASASERLQVAIVGLGARLGGHESLRTLGPALLGGVPDRRSRPAGRWGVAHDSGAMDAVAGELAGPLPGAWIDHLDVPVGLFKLPPKEVPAVLPQHLVSLLAVHEAAEDAGWDGGGARDGCVVGVGLDLESSGFALRWEADPVVRSRLGEPLDGVRTQGALGGMIASRVARELGLGGPSFLVSNEDGSGARALEVACRLLDTGVLDRAVVVASDMSGDVRSVLATHRLRPYALDGVADGLNGGDRAAPGEGAVAVVLERLADVRARGGRVHAVVTGLGSSHGTAVDSAVDAAWEEAGAPLSSAGLIELTRGADAQLTALSERSGEHPVAIGLSSTVCGDTGAASGMVSVLRAVLALREAVLPADPTFRCNPLLAGSLHVPLRPLPWLSDSARGPRRAGVSCVGVDGCRLHIVLEEPPRELSAATGFMAASRSAGLFLVDGDDSGELSRAGQRLEAFIREVPESSSIDALARRWHRSGLGREARENGHVPGRRVFVAASVRELRARVREALIAGPLVAPPHTPGQLAWVFPGSGNHYVGMGQDLLLGFPSVARALHGETESLASQLVPRRFAPYRADWTGDWRTDGLALAEITPHEVIFAQVAHGVTVARVLNSLGVTPDAALGYSLGESAALFSTGCWTDRDAMFQRVLRSPLFKTQLAGSNDVAAEAWGGPRDWWVAVLDVDAERARAAAAAGGGTAEVLIVNAPNECVVGGRRPDVEALADHLGAHARPLFGVPTVHCGLVEAVAEEYRSLHLLPTEAQPGVTVYSGAWGRSYEVSDESAADSILSNALRGVDWPKTVLSAWEDGVRIFVECGPQGSCTRMIHDILQDRPHVAVTACRRGRDGVHNLMDAIAQLLEAGVAVDLDALYPVESVRPAVAGRVTVVRPGQGVLRAGPVAGMAAPLAAAAAPLTAERPLVTAMQVASTLGASPLTVAHDTALAHAAWLSVTRQQADQARAALAQQHALISALLGGGATASAPRRAEARPPSQPRFDRAACMDFAVGSVRSTYGEDWAFVDALPTRVRLPDEPLMLVDRIVSVQGEQGSMTSGRVVTEHDVLEQAWYLDGGRAPVCISVEAGQADLFLSGWLGIDRETRGERVYRLLDAEVAFHRDLPEPGEVIRYDIAIDRFIRQGSTWLFFFHFEGWIGEQHLISMRDGCAGFFSRAQLADGKGLVERRGALPAGRRRSADGGLAAAYSPLVPGDSLADRSSHAPLQHRGPSTLDAAAVAALRSGDLEAAFGPAFAARRVHPSLALPGGRMELVHRISELDLSGGRYGLGVVESEWDVDPQGWYLVCHFSDDRVMPGTLMYEGCLHTLRVLLLRLGWGLAADSAHVHHAPIPEIPSRLRCRGQVLDTTRTLTYRIDIKEIGYDPEPYVLADAFMVADGRDIVEFENVSYRVVGSSESQLTDLWSPSSRDSRDASPFGPVSSGKPARFDRDSILAFAVGNPSQAFGAPYLPFDAGRRIARLPGPPFCFLDRITEVQAEPFVLAPGGWIEAEYDVPEDAWYFAANGQRSMPFAILLEIALQPCGWLAAYLGSALRSEQDLHFRNLDGTATLHGEIGPRTGTLTTRVRMTSCSEAGGMILQEFQFQLWGRGDLLYDGHTGFGFFPSASLANQVGVRGAAARAWEPSDDASFCGWDVPSSVPLTPSAASSVSTPVLGTGVTLPGGALCMIDRVDCWLPGGGHRGLGWIKGSKDVDPQDWFFAAHFHQDPVIPGSLGLEGLLQLLRIVATKRWGDHILATHRLEPIGVGVEHTWVYRGQVVPSNAIESVEACITAVSDGPVYSLTADGFLRVDGRIIYEMKSFQLRLVPNTTPLERS